MLLVAIFSPESISPTLTATGAPASSAAAERNLSSTSGLPSMSWAKPLASNMRSPAA